MTEFECKECEVNYSVNQTLKDHIEKIHKGEKEFKCYVCNKFFYKNNILSKHYIKKHPNITRVYPCEECEHDFPNNSKLQRHLFTVHINNKKDKECPECKKKFYKEDILSKHKQNKHPDINFNKCEECEVEFDDLSGYRTHQLVHENNEKDSECRFCGKLFYGPIIMRKHQKNKHPELDPKKCYDCDIVFNRLDGCDGHIKNIHTNEIFEECIICDKNINKKMMAKHLSLHIEENDNKCPICNVKLQVQGNLYYHIRSVHGEKKIECDECGMKFSTDDRLNRHIDVVHMKIKDKKCLTCDYECYGNYKLMEHVNQVHLNIKNFSCEDCSFQCYLKHDLKRHYERTHLKLKFYRCEKCPLEFYTKTEYNTHIKACSGELKYSRMEHVVATVLEKNNIEFDYNETYNDMINSKSSRLRVDFILWILDKPMFVETDGRQHYEPVNFGGCSNEAAKEQHEKIKINDIIKNKYAEENSIPLLRIPYHEKLEHFESIVMEFIFINSIGINIFN